MKTESIAFSCGYTPLPLIAAAGFAPLRILPLSAAPDQAGTVLHDNLCPHVKRLLDRALDDDLPAYRGAVFMNSCDAMRRLADAWSVARPDDAIALVDLPIHASDGAISYFAGELERLTKQLGQWAGRDIHAHDIEQSLATYDQLAAGLVRLAERHASGELAGGAAGLQQIYNESVNQPLDQALAMVQKRLQKAATAPAKGTSRVPIYLFGNVLPDPAAIAMFESCGCHLVTADLCTGSRQITPLACDGPGSVFERLARGLLRRPSCARTIDTATPDQLGREVTSQAQRAGVRGVIAHVMKFCDPYLARLPAVREQLEQAGLPLLLLEGDCSLGSLGQQRTRIEAFVEMLGGQDE